MQIKWERGFDRLGNVLLVLLWVGFLGLAFTSDMSAGAFGERLVYMFFISGGLVLAGRCLKWIIRGFLGD